MLDGAVWVSSEAQSTALGSWEKENFSSEFFFKGGGGYENIFQNLGGYENISEILGGFENNFQNYARCMKIDPEFPKLF